MPPDVLDSILDGPFELTPRPEPLPGDLRLAWGIALVVLMLGKSRGKRASLQKLHFLAHSIRTRQTRVTAQRVFAQTLSPSEIVVRVEPWLNRALAFARGATLIDIQGGRSAILTEGGLRLLETLYEDDNLLADEKQFLESVGTKATEKNVDKIMRMEFAL